MWTPPYDCPIQIKTILNRIWYMITYIVNDVMMQWCNAHKSCMPVLEWIYCDFIYCVFVKTCITFLLDVATNAQLKSSNSKNIPNSIPIFSIPFVTGPAQIHSFFWATIFCWYRPNSPRFIEKHSKLPHSNLRQSVSGNHQTVCSHLFGLFGR